MSDGIVRQKQNVARQLKGIYVPVGNAAFTLPEEICHLGTLIVPHKMSVILQETVKFTPCVYILTVIFFKYTMHESGTVE
jgi:hypothetical protein